MLRESLRSYRVYTEKGAGTLGPENESLENPNGDGSESIRIQTPSIFYFLEGNAYILLHI
jgi:hypothetical protein